VSWLLIWESWIRTLICLKLGSELLGGFNSNILSLLFGSDSGFWKRFNMGLAKPSKRLQKHRGGGSSPYGANNSQCSAYSVVTIAVNLIGFVCPTIQIDQQNALKIRLYENIPSQTAEYC
jgi:hypothetical protein